MGPFVLLKCHNVDFPGNIAFDATVGMVEAVELVIAVTLNAIICASVFLIIIEVWRRELPVGVASPADDDLTTQAGEAASHGRRRHSSSGSGDSDGRSISEFDLYPETTSAWPDYDDKCVDTGEDDGDLANGDGEGARGDGEGARGDGEAARGDGEEARGDGEGARGDGEGARGDGEGARGDGEMARGDDDGARGDGEGARGSGDAENGAGDAARNKPVKEVDGSRRCRQEAESGDQSCSVADGIDAYRDVAFCKPRPLTMSGSTLLSDESVSIFMDERSPELLPPYFDLSLADTKYLTPECVSTGTSRPRRHRSSWPRRKARSLSRAIRRVASRVVCLSCHTVDAD